MTPTNGAVPRLLAGCNVLPPLEPTPEPSENTPEGAVAQRTRPAKRKAAERFAALNAFVDFTAGTLGRGELLVWLVLFRDARDGIARTAQADIARRVGIGQRTVRWALRRLEARGLVAVVRRGGIGRGPSSYKVRPAGTEVLRQ